MKKGSFLRIGAFLTALVLAPNLLSADTFEIRYSGEKISSTTPKEIYGHYLSEYSIQASKSLTEALDLWMNIGYSRKDGRSIGMSDFTRLKVIPVSAGITWVFQTETNFKPYVGAGLSYNKITMHDQSAYVDYHVKKWQLGAVLKSGVRYHFYESFFADAFIDYAHQKFHFSGDDGFVSRSDVNLSGFKIGLGLGVSF